ncbi:MAG TPA: efflux RND transporter periplasmic adaptor subunit [bacterium]|nr:efflux RND transporter periplasmic adaptor subunit [bacterium]
MAIKWRSRKKLLIGGGIALIIIVFALISLTKSGDKRTVVQADVAIKDDITELVNASGRIQPQTKVNIVAEVSAEIREIYVREGDRVTKGQPLLLLDTVQLKSDVAQARYSLDELTSRTASAKAQFERDKLEAERQEKLYAQKLSSETEYTNARLAYESSKAEYDAMEAQVKTGRARLDKALDNLRKTRITAPMDGVVTYLGAEVGEISQAQTSFTQGQTLMTIADLSVFEVEVDVDETEVAKVQVGQTAKIRVDAFRDTSFAGEVVEVGNSATISGQGTESYTTSFRVKVRFADANPGVRPGMSASVDITTATAADALLVPYAAVVTREFDPDSLKKSATPVEEASAVGTAHAAATDDPDAESTESGPARKAKKIRKTGVFLIKDGKAAFREIRTGIADDRNIAVHEGLAPGDSVVSGSFQTLRRLSDGELVRVDNPTGGGPDKK